MRRSPSATTVLLILLPGVLFSGCSEPNPLNRQAIWGNITLAGNPLDNGTIEFYPSGTTGIMSGAVVTDGSYSIAANRGLPEGEYIVRISAAKGEPEPELKPGAMPEASRKPAKERIPPEFNVRSQVKIQVQVGQSNSFNFDIPAAAK